MTSCFTSAYFHNTLTFPTRPLVSFILIITDVGTPLLRQGQADFTHPVPVSPRVSDFWEGSRSTSLILPSVDSCKFQCPITRLSPEGSTPPLTSSSVASPPWSWAHVLGSFYDSLSAILLKSVIPSAKFSHPSHSPVPNQKPSQVTQVPGGRL